MSKEQSLDEAELLASFEQYLLSDLGSLSPMEQVNAMNNWFVEHYFPIDEILNTEGTVTMWASSETPADVLEKRYSESVPKYVIDILVRELNKESRMWIYHEPPSVDVFAGILPASEQKEAFHRSIDDTAFLLSQDLPANVQTHLFNVLYASQITALETYLSDYLIARVVSDPLKLRKFVENDKTFGKQTFSYKEIFIKHETIQDAVVTHLRKLLWHNLPKVISIYQITLGIKCKVDSLLFEAVEIRHDIVHRNGRSIDGIERKIGLGDITEVAEKCTELVDSIENQWINLWEAETAAKLLGD